ncbi:MAG: class I lanthipeptide [Bacteroidales bacterium]|nr:class I lanthipeptide [Bacteroidales bacterium]
MKKKKLKGKLTLNKQKISNLNEIKGGLFKTRLWCKETYECPKFPDND